MTPRLSTLWPALARPAPAAATTAAPDEPVAPDLQHQQRRLLRLAGIGLLLLVLLACWRIELHGRRLQQWHALQAQQQQLQELARLGQATERQLLQLDPVDGAALPQAVRIRAALQRLQAGTGRIELRGGDAWPEDLAALTALAAELDEPPPPGPLQQLRRRLYTLDANLDAAAAARRLQADALWLTLQQQPWRDAAALALLALLLLWAGGRQLARLVAQLGAALRQSERDLEIQRRHAFHQEKMAALGAMAAGVIQEIGNPIAAIDGYARAQQQCWAQRPAAGLAADEQALCDPALILHETGRLRAITHQIAELATPPSSEAQLCSLNQLVERTLALLRFDVRFQHLRVQARLDPELPALQAAADQLTQLLLNLLGNAADALRARPPGEARLQICSGVEHGLAVLRIADNGPGMSAQVRARAFEPLYTTKPPGCGTGLGLPLCLAIAHSHAGTLELESVPGQGTTVTLRLPLPGGAA